MVSHHVFGIHSSMPAMRPGSEGCRGPIAQQCGSQWNSQCTWVSEQDFLSRVKAVLWDRRPWGPKQFELCVWPSCGFLMQGPQYSDDFGGNISLPPAIVWLPVLRLGFATAVRDVLSIKVMKNLQPQTGPGQNIFFSFFYRFGHHFIYHFLFHLYFHSFFFIILFFIFLSFYFSFFNHFFIILFFISVSFFYHFIFHFLSFFYHFF